MSNNGTNIDASNLETADVLLVKKVPTGFGGTRQVALYALAAGGYAVQTIYRLPAGCTKHDTPVYFADEPVARQAYRAG